MARRRIEKMGRLAFQVATWLNESVRSNEPLIFASRHGDANRSVALLEALAKGEPMSPTSFALSVHNAVGAQYSIISGVTANVSAVANGRFTVESAVVEAATLLREASSVMVVVYDASPDAFFAAHHDEPAADFAWAVRLVSGTDFALETTAPGAVERGPLPHALEVLRFLLQTEPTLSGADEIAGWRWTRRESRVE